MVKKKISKAFSTLGYNFKTWAVKNKIEVLKVAGAISGAILVYTAGCPEWFSGLMGLVVKFCLDFLHYWLSTQEIE